MKRKPNPVPVIDLAEVANNAMALEEFAGQPAFSGSQVERSKRVQPMLPLPLTAMLLF